MYNYFLIKIKLRKEYKFSQNNNFYKKRKLNILFIKNE